MVMQHSDQVLSVCIVFGKGVAAWQRERCSSVRAERGHTQARDWRASRGSRSSDAAPLQWHTCPSYYMSSVQCVRVWMRSISGREAPTWDRARLGVASLRDHTLGCAQQLQLHLPEPRDHAPRLRQLADCWGAGRYSSLLQQVTPRAYRP